MKQCVKPSVEKAVQDLLGLVVERSIKVALTTTEHIIKKVKCGHMTMYIRMYVCMYVHMYVYMYVCTYIHVCM